MRPTHALLLLLAPIILFDGCGGSHSIVPTPIPTPTPTNTNGQWAWISGTSYTSLTAGAGQTGVYGTLGTPSTANIPGSRGSASGWVASDGSLWILGGYGLDSTGTPGDLNDLWSFNPATKQWTWMGGSDTVKAIATYGTQGAAATSNNPGALASPTTWLDASGNFWLFGGAGYDAAGNSGALNDLWEFSTATKTWTWVTGSQAFWAPSVYGTLGQANAANTPGARQRAASWVDSSGNLWLMGGYANGQNDWDDLWEFTPGTKEWTWVGGSSTAASIGVYGTIGVSAVGNHPGAREYASTFTDASGNLWLFGGAGYDATGNRAQLNDLWELNPSTLTWTWISGSNKTLAPGSYGAQGEAAASNTPGAREVPATWTDSSGNFWLLGGAGYDASGTQGDLNDLWKFSITSKQWTWMGGSNQVNALGVYGTEGATAAGNAPGSRALPLGITDASGNFWLFGGYAPGTAGPENMALNDLWRYHP